MRDRLIELLNTDMSGCNGDFAEEMADYLIENGVIVPPVKVGDTVYSLYLDKIESYVVQSIEIDSLATDGINSMLFGFESVGKTVFLTKEEAEKHLQGGVQE